MDILRVIDKRKNWWRIFIAIFTVSIAVVGYIGAKSYDGAPPQATFVDETGDTVFSHDQIIGGQQLFLRRGLMDYGSFLGDGGMRGPDYTAEALNLTARWMNEDYLSREKGLAALSERERKLLVHTIEARVQLELKENRYDAQTDTITLNDAQVLAFGRLKEYYAQMFGRGGDLVGDEAFQVPDYITDPAEVAALSSFFYWGGWLCAAERPGETYSYTHNWPYDPLAGNAPHGGLVLWSLIGILVVILTIGMLFYFYGRLDREAMVAEQAPQFPPLATTHFVNSFRPMPTQRATYKFFAVAAILFLVQVVAGILTIVDFIGIDSLLPLTVTRAWHSQISILWIAVCWFASTIWVLPLICRPEPKWQLGLINALFWMLVLVAGGVAVGIPLGINGLLSNAQTRWFGLQGWEFMTMGRIFQHVLFWSFMLWLLIVTRGLMPALKQKQSWSLPNWMVYSISGITLMFCASFVATPETNFVIADFWRWCTVHMWVEAFFELFTTIIVAYFLYLMGFISHLIAARVVYLGALLFLGSGLVGISHNFYWNAKSIETIALGGVLSSLQIAPLVLLTVEAWRFRKMPSSTLYKLKAKGGDKATFGLTTAFMFLVAVNFWNFFGAGVLGFSINLPIVSYYEHGTYLTVNHGHAALMGVYGNLGVCAMLFCARWNIGADRWNKKLLHTVFWSLNIGLALMVTLDLFPVGIDQLVVAMSEGGYVLARSQQYLQSDTFQLFTLLRGIGVLVFTLGGVVPLTWFMVTRWFRLKPVQTPEEQFVVPESVLAVAPVPSQEAK